MWEEEDAGVGAGAGVNVFGSDWRLININEHMCPADAKQTLPWSLQRAKINILLFINHDQGKRVSEDE